MAAFDFIVGEAFRASLEADNAELRSCLHGGAFKAVHVVAGSMVEAMLADALLATDYEKRTKKKVLEMDLAALVQAAKKETLITSSTADLCSAVRNYRNLIHPGRMIRLKDEVSEDRAKIAVALVDVISDDLARQKKEAYGLTATQIVTKLTTDTSALAILDDLIKSAPAVEIRSLLLEKLPDKYKELSTYPDFFSASVLPALSRAFRMAFESASRETQHEVLSSFLRILREEPGSVVTMHESAFFRASDLGLMTTDDRKTVKNHLLAELKRNPSSGLMHAVDGIGNYLEPNEAPALVDGAIRHVLVEDTDERRKLAAEILENAWWDSLFDAAHDSIGERIEDWLAHFARNGQADLHDWLQVVQKGTTVPDVQEADIPSTDDEQN